MGSIQYEYWFLAQTPERQAESQANLDACKRLGEVQRVSPRSKEALDLTEQVRAYYARHDHEGKTA